DAAAGARIADEAWLISIHPKNLTHPVCGRPARWPTAGTLDVDHSEATIGERGKQFKTERRVVAADHHWRSPNRYAASTTGSPPLSPVAKSAHWPVCRLILNEPGRLSARHRA